MEWDRALVAKYKGHLGGVYFVQSGDFIKIGVSWHVFSRVLEAAWGWNPHDVRPLGWIPEPDSPVAERLEEKLHRLFAEDHHRGEWFKASDALLTFIKENAEPWVGRVAR